MPFYATTRKIEDEYQLEIEGEPIGFTYDQGSFLRQVEHLRSIGFSVVDDFKNPAGLEDLLS